MSEITRELVYGKSPIQRSNPQAGQSEWYYLDPRGAETVSEMKQIDVPYEHSPNPYANEIRNYLYNNDRDNYKLLYGDAMPPVENNVGQQYTVKPRIWETAAEGKQVYNDVIKREGNFTPSKQNMFSYDWAAIRALSNIFVNYLNLKNMNLSDKYKHAYINCEAAQYGKGGTDVASIVSNLGEINDRITGKNTLDSSEGDQYANKIGRLLGNKYPEDNCDEIIRKYINKTY